MVYIRGQAQDYDHWAQLGNRGWSWQDVLPVYKRLEAYDGGSDELRGRNGPLRVTDTPREKIPPLEKMIEAANKIGLPFNPDLNGATQEGIGMSQVTIAKGRRQRGHRLQRLHQLAQAPEALRHRPARQPLHLGGAGPEAA